MLLGNFEGASVLLNIVFVFFHIICVLNRHIIWLRKLKKLVLLEAIYLAEGAIYCAIWLHHRARKSVFPAR